MMGRKLFVGAMLALTILTGSWVPADEPGSKPGKAEPAAANGSAKSSPAEKPAAARVDYLTQIKPVLSRRCVACHGHLRQESGLRVDAARFLLKGGDRGPAVVAGDIEQSVLIDALSGQGDLKMPPEGEPLTAEEVKLIRTWVEQGAAGPSDEKVIEDPRKHWSFQPPVRPALPTVKEASSARNPIDAFVMAGLEARGLTPLPRAPRNLLLRRVTLDLTGLPPTPEELRAFLADDSPDAYAKAVDRLLDSPQYGERWGRHWMDVWRYSDWYGYQKELRNSARHIWRWRDWIVDSLNADKPYDQMVVEMIAGDELAPNDPQTLRATGYLARSYYKFNRNVWLDTAIEHTSKAFLGMTLNCARCHEHKYDPISQEEYYHLRAIFEPYEVRTDSVPGQLSTELDGLSRVFDAKLDEKTFLFQRGDEKLPVKDHALDPSVPELFSKIPFQVEPVSLPATARYPGLRPFVRDEALASANAEVTKERTAVEKARQVLPTGGAETATSPAAVELSVAEKRLAAAESALASLQARIAADDAKYTSPPAANVKELSKTAARLQREAELRRGEAELATLELDIAHKKAATGNQDAKTKKELADAEAKLKPAREKVEKAIAALKEPGEEYAALSETYPEKSTGRRLALARFIVDRKNPLAARVAVNHIWLRHFGQAIVPSVFDFGLNGRAPSDPELLDWLAVELMENGWRMKSLHRLIVLSEAYQRDSAAPVGSPNVTIDADNIYLWRMNARRMESEAVRDSVLFVAGKLDLTQGGPELDSEKGLSTFRRSIYYRHAPEKFMTFLELFDSASTTECYQRRPTVVPQQALALVNSPLALEQSRQLATRLMSESPRSGDGTDPQQEQINSRYINDLFERVLCRAPNDEELQTCRQFLHDQTALLSKSGDLTKFTTGNEPTLHGSGDPRQRARENLAHVLLNHHEFVTIR